jgi:hypothetical protein
VIRTPDPILAPVGSRVEGLMLVHQVERRAWGEGRESIILVLGTQAGRIGTAPLWGERRAWAAGIVRGTVVNVSGLIGVFRGVRQLELSALHHAPPGRGRRGGLGRPPRLSKKITIPTYLLE